MINPIYEKLMRENNLQEPYYEDVNFGLMIGNIGDDNCEVIPKYI